MRVGHCRDRERTNLDAGAQPGPCDANQLRGWRTSAQPTQGGREVHDMAAQAMARDRGGGTGGVQQYDVFVGRYEGQTETSAQSNSQ